LATRHKTWKDKLNLVPWGNAARHIGKKDTYRVESIHSFKHPLEILEHIPLWIKGTAVY
jgi:hypothetical protein